MKIDELLNKYFEGETSCLEERELRRFFTEEEVPEHLLVYRPLFVCLAQEIKEQKNGRTTGLSSRKPSRMRRIIYTWGGIAAGLLLLTGVANLFRSATPAESYVIIDGIRYTDRQLVEAKALEALQNVSFTEDDLNKLLFN